MSQTSELEQVGSLCGTCPRPGSCCKGFVLNRVFPEGADEQEVQTFLDEQGFPFAPLRQEEESREGDGEGRRWVFDCPELLPSGRCGIYDQRPEVCRIFEPGVDCDVGRDPKVGPPKVPAYAADKTIGISDV